MKEKTKPTFYRAEPPVSKPDFRVMPQETKAVVSQILLTYLYLKDMCKMYGVKETEAMELMKLLFK